MPYPHQPVQPTPRSNRFITQMRPGLLRTIQTAAHLIRQITQPSPQTRHENFFTASAHLSAGGNPDTRKTNHHFVHYARFGAYASDKSIDSIRRTNFATAEDIIHQRRTIT